MSHRKGVIFLHEGTFPDGYAMAFRLRMYTEMLENDFDVKVLVPRLPKSNDNSKKYHLFTLWNRNVSSNILVRKLSYYIQDLKWTYFLYQNRNQFDVIFVAAMSIFPLLVITLFAKLFSKRLILELNEFPYSSQGGNFIDDLNGYKRYRRFLTENLIYKNIFGVISISPKLTQYIKKLVPNISVVEIPILCDVQYFKSLDSIESFQTPKQKYTVHASNLSEYKDGFSTNLKAIGKFNLEQVREDDKIHLYITLDGIPPLLSQSINQILTTYDLHSFVHFIGYQDDISLFNLYKNAAFLIINKPINLQNDYNFPTKLSEYLYFSKALLVSTNNAMDQFLEDSQNCLKFESNNDQDLLNLIKKLLSNQIQMNGLNFNARNTVTQHFDFRMNAAKLNLFFRNA